MQSQVRFNRICGHLIHGNPAEVFPAPGFAAPFRKMCKNKTLRLLGIPPKLIHPASCGVAAHTAGLFRSVRGAKGGFSPWGLPKLRIFTFPPRGGSPS